MVLFNSVCQLPVVIKSFSEIKTRSVIAFCEISATRQGSKTLLISIILIFTTKLRNLWGQLLSSRCNLAEFLAKWNEILTTKKVHLQSALIRAPLCGRPTAIRPSARPTVHLFFWNIFYPFCLVLIAIISLHTQKAFWWRLCSWQTSFEIHFFVTIAVNQLLFACANFCEVRGTLIIANFLAANQYSCVSCDLFVI